jgi:hypothetical protein
MRFACLIARDVDTLAAVKREIEAHGGVTFTASGDPVGAR